MTRASEHVYGHVCLSCGTLFAHNDGYAKHVDPRTGEKCRDVSGSSSCPEPMGPCATRPWGPQGVLAALRYDASYDYNWYPPSPEHVAQHIREGLVLLAPVVGVRDPQKETT